MMKQENIGLLEEMRAYLRSVTPAELMAELQSYGTTSGPTLGDFLPTLQPMLGKFELSEVFQQHAPPPTFQTPHTASYETGLFF